MNRRLVGATLLLATLALGACRKKPVAIDPVPTSPTTAPAIDDGAAARRAREQFLRDSLARAAAEGAARASEAEAANLRAILEAAVLFEYDASDITDQARATLDAKLPVLRTNTALRLRISGHTDARGSDEYNLALGLRRAASTRKYLSDRGIAVSRIDVVSFGEERPAASGDDDGAFSQNRRAEFEILSGGESLRVPPR
ncbi:MAG: OmpA family protein [Gemmatimonadaceae bacterium]|nr:OmpA family protein [Gemmatimonadaceae bacterium]